MSDLTNVILALQIADRLTKVARRALQDGRTITDEELDEAVRARRDGIEEWELADKEERNR
jgi:hypothetical protein